MNRRHFLYSTLAAAIATSLGAAEQRAPRILFRSAWQTVNIGDIAHTPGILALAKDLKAFVEKRQRETIAVLKQNLT